MTSIKFVGGCLKGYSFKNKRYEANIEDCKPHLYKPDKIQNQGVSMIIS